MRIPRVYTPQTLQLNTVITLNERASHYLGKVLRMEADRPVIVFNGEGGEYSGHLYRVSKKHVEVKLDSFSPHNRQTPLRLELAVSLSRGERWDWVLQKASELGATHIVPLTTERTEVKLRGERLAKKQQHWQQIIISACEQCQRNILPQLMPLTTLDDYLTRCSGDIKLVLHHRDSQTLANTQTPQSVSLLIGPEGGLSEAEIAAAEQRGFTPLTLGPRVLRTETAPLAALSVIQFQWGDLADSGK